MRPVGEPVPVAVCLPAAEVALESMGVDDRGRSLDLLGAHAGRRAIASISTRSPGGRPAWTVVRAGYGSVKNSRYTALYASNSARSDRNAFTFTTSSIVQPVAARHARTFSSVLRACSAIESPTRAPVSSNATCPAV